MNAFQSATSYASLEHAWKYRRFDLKRSCFGIDRVNGNTFERNLGRELQRIVRRISTNFKPDDLLALVKPKPNGGFRIICVPTIADRIVQFSILNELRPSFRTMGLDNSVSFGLVQGRERSVFGARDLACKIRAERPWVYKTDIHKFFDNIPRQSLRQSLNVVVRKSSLRPILDDFMCAEIGDGLEPNWKRVVSEAGIRKGLGIRQGMPLSSFFAGVYLRNLDQSLVRSGSKTIRYVDDVISFFETEVEALAFHSWLKGKLLAVGLEIGDPDSENSKTKIYSPQQSADFLGMELNPKIVGGYQLRIGRRSLDKIVQSIADACSPSALLDRKVSLTNMGTYFDSVRAGYINAYTGAHNRDELRDAIDSAIKRSQRKVLEHLFGRQRLSSFGRSDLKFLGIDDDNVLN